MSLEPGRLPNGRWRRGVSGNPQGRRVEQDPQRRRVRELARECTEDAVDALHSIATDEQAQPMARVRASEALLARGYGTATDEVSAAALDRGPDEVEVIRFVMPMNTDSVELAGELIDDEPPAVPPPAA